METSPCKWVYLDPNRDYGELFSAVVREYCNANHGGAAAIINMGEKYRELREIAKMYAKHGG